MFNDSTKAFRFYTQTNQLLLTLVEVSLTIFD
jgi:hypothetical protein